MHLLLNSLTLKTSKTQHFAERVSLMFRPCAVSHIFLDLRAARCEKRGLQLPGSFSVSCSQSYALLFPSLVFLFNGLKKMIILHLINMILRIN